MAGKKKSAWRSRILYVLFLVALLFTVGEIFVRAMGFGPWSPPDQSLEIHPEGPFFQAHPTLGYTGKPGPFTLTLAHPDTPPITFRVTHNPEGYRLTAPPSDTLDQRPEVWFLGCSFTHGYGVDDTATYPWQLQQHFPAYQFRNYAMDGYGTYHSLLQLRDLLATRPQPPRVRRADGGFHDQRNVNSRYWRKALSSQRIAEGIQYPYVRQTESGSLEEAISPIEYSPWPGQRISALVHFFENAANRSEDKGLNSYAVTKNLVDEMSDELDARDVPFVVAGIYEDEGTAHMIREFAQHMKALDVSEGLREEDMRILPRDLHPNAAGHRLIAERLYPIFEEYLSVPTDSLP